jgi:hypothetical protein
MAAAAAAAQACMERVGAIVQRVCTAVKALGQQTAMRDNPLNKVR